jgi:uncharacterized protein with PIN domain
MDSAQFRFYDGLNHFLPREKRHTTITHHFDWRASIKDMVESLGVPHAEIELLIANGRSVDFSYLVQPGDDIHVYSRFDAVDGPDRVRLRLPWVGRPRFVLDTHLGRLASYLRMMGFDTLYRSGDYPDRELAQVSHDEQRILLTRDVGVLKRSLVVYGYYVRSTNPRRQIVEVVDRFNLSDSVEPFKYCLKCNGRLEPVKKEDILDRLPLRTQQHFDEFHRCRDCGQIFWKGSHYERMQAFMAEILGQE